MHIWVLDIGTSGTHGQLMNQNASVLFSFYEEYHASFGSNGTVEQSPSDWYRAVLHASQACADFLKEKNMELDAVSLTCQRSSLLLLDERWEPIAPAMMWQDTRALSALERLEKEGQAVETVFEKSGTWPNPVFTGPKILWYQKNRPEVLKNARHTTVIADYLIAKMTGKPLLDVTYAARTHLMHLYKEQWDPELLQIFGASEEKLSPLCAQGSVAGRISSAFAMISGLPAGIPVISAGGDQQCAALGAGVFQRGQVLVNVGTGANILLWSDDPVLDKAHRFLTIPAAVHGKYLLESSTLTAASVYRWGHEQFYPEDDTYARMDAEAEQAGPGAHGLLLLPYFQGRGTPDWNRAAVGTFHGIRLKTTRGDFARAILEGIALEIAENLSAMGSCSQIMLSGGLSACSFFGQLLADVTSIPVYQTRQSNQSALGAWANAVHALSPELGYDEILQRGESSKKTICLPHPAANRVYSEILIQKKSLYNRIYGL